MPAVFSLAVAIVFGLLNGWLIAYAEVPSLFTTLASGLFLAGFGQVFFFPVDVVQWSPDLYSLSWIGRGDVLGIPKPVIMFAVAAAVMAAFLRLTRLGAFIYSVGDNLLAARATGIPTRPLIVLQYLVAALIGAFAGIVMAASLESMPTRVFNSTLIYDVVLVVVSGRRRPLRGPRRRIQCRHWNIADWHAAQRHDADGPVVFSPELHQGADPALRSRIQLASQSSQRGDSSARRYLMAVAFRDDRLHQGRKS